MKRPVVTAAWLCALAGLAGCPIYDHEDAGCYRDSDCGSDYVCQQSSGDCVRASESHCIKPSDCDTTATCSAAGSCVFGDCTFNGCVAGYRCDSSSGVWECVPNASGAAGSPGAEAGASSAGASGAPDLSTGGVAGSG